MGVFDKLRAQFIDIIECLDSINDAITYYFDGYNNKIKIGEQPLFPSFQGGLGGSSRNLTF